MTPMLSVFIFFNVMFAWVCLKHTDIKAMFYYGFLSAWCGGLAVTYRYFLT